MQSWMWNKYESLKTVPINKIMLPGTHNSGTYIVDFNNSFIWNNDIVNKLKKYKSWSSVKKITTNWTKCQEMTIYEQLRAGIRLIDLRVSQYEGVYYITHTLTCVNIDVVLDDIVNFLEENSNEALVICCKPDWENRGTMNNITVDFYNYVCNKIGNYLCPSSQTFPTYGEIVDMKKNIIFTYNEYVTDDRIWNSFMFNNPWTNTSDIKKKLEGLEQSITEQESDLLNTLDFMLTPQTSDIVKSVLTFGCFYHCASIRGMAGKFNNYLDKFIITNDTKLHNTGGIFMDFPSIENIKKIVEYNF